MRPTDHGLRGDVFRIQSQPGLFGKLLEQLRIADLQPVTRQPREGDLGFCSLGQGVDGARRPHDAVLVFADGGHELERDAVHVGVLGGEEAVLVWLVGAAAQAAADDLLAEQLGAERADAEDVGDGVGVPALGEHGDGDDAADRLAELA